MQYENKLPASCCGFKDNEHCTVSHVYKEGCSEKIATVWNTHSKMIKAGVSGIAVMMVKKIHKSKSHSKRI